MNPNPKYLQLLSVMNPGSAQFSRGLYRRGIAGVTIPALAYLVYEITVFRNATWICISKCVFVAGLVFSSLDALYWMWKIPAPEPRNQKWLYLLTGFNTLVLGSYFLFDHSHTWKMTSDSMEPSYQKNDFVVADTRYGATLPLEKGDVIAFKSPANPSEILIMRIISWGTDRIEMKDKVLFINQQELEQKPTDEIQTKGKNIRRENNGPVSYLVAFDPLVPGTNQPASLDVPRETFFVMGDNRDHSIDSREWGLVPAKNILGKIRISYRPFVRRPQ